MCTTTLHLKRVLRRWRQKYQWRLHLLYLPGASKYNFMRNSFSVFIFPAIYVQKHLERIARDQTPHGNETLGAASPPTPPTSEDVREYRCQLLSPSNVNQRTRTRQSLPLRSGWKLEAFRRSRAILGALEMVLGKEGKKDLQIETFWGKIPCVI